MTQRFKIIVEYDGGSFVGWQAQENGPSVQVEIEDAIHAFSGERMRIIAAGRTDAGVHARGQVSHFDLKKEITADKLQAALNAHLRPQPISILSVELVPDDFSARFSATKRHYLYRILNRRAPPALNRGRAWHVAAPLDAGAMNEAAKRLIGRHDFTTFRAAGCQAKSPEKTLDVLTVERPGPGSDDGDGSSDGDGEEILIRASAQSFLHNQVRSMVGTLKLVGEGKWSAADVSDALEARDRARVGFNAPPEGLYLMKVDY